MATKEMTAVGAYVVPKVNLLPPEIEERKAQRRSYVIMGGAIAAAIVVVVFAYVAQASRVSEAKDSLAAAQARDGQLTRERAALQPVQDVYNNVDAHEALLAQAQSSRVRWSRFLHDLQVTIPDRVWVNSFTATLSAPTAPASGQAVGSTAVLKPGVGNVLIGGSAFEHNDVAAWLDSLTKVKGYADPYFTSSTLVLPTSDSPDARAIVKFTSSVTLTPAAITPTDKAGTK
jgi:Tfp pilus assembly protein PilN